MATTEAAEDVVEAAPRGVSPKALIGLVFALVLISNGAWAAVFFMADRGAMGGSDETTEAASDEPAPAEAPGPLVQMKPLVVNLTDIDGVRFLRVEVSVELGAEKHQEVFEARRVPLRDAFLSHLSGLESREVLTRKDKDRLRVELLEIAQETVSERAIQKVYFTEFMMQ